MISGQILVATDFSAEADKLKDRLEELREIGLKKILLVHVLEPKLTKKIGGVSEINNKLSVLAEEYNKIGFEVETEILKGDPAEQLKELAVEENCFLILIASHGQSFIKNVPIGHTAYKIARQVKTPLIIDKFKNYADKEFLDDNNLSNLELMSSRIFDKILLPLDLSSVSYKVFDLLKTLKDNIEFTEIELLHVIESSIDEEDLNQQKSDAEAEFEKLSDYLKKHGLTKNVKMKIKTGSASEVIIEEARNEKISLVIMTKSGEDFIENKLLGSTTDTIIKHISIPVLIVPPSLY
ncbi:MAG: universal stress protein [Halarsenatibacteraceae bacterium]